MNKMDIQGSNDDCYFYFYSSCMKGEDCQFRHCLAALGTETVCSLWREGRCFRENCKFRHMESRINRSSIACYWENQPGGCRKPHCVFLHRRSRLNIHSSLENKLILPVSTSAPLVNPTSKVPDSKDPVKSTMVSSPLENYSNHNSSDANLSSTSHPVKPFVVSFDEGEESDSESVSSTPVKSSSESKYNSAGAKRDLSESLSGKPGEDNFGIKTLEQIRMEKIHKESEHFYKSDDTPTANVIPNKTLGVSRSTTFGDKIFSYTAYDAPFLDSPQSITLDILSKAECYPPASDFITISEKPQDASASGDPSHHLSDKERDLRSRLLKRKSAPSYLEKPAVPTKKISNVKKSKKEEGPLNFKIKTLDEIRKERESKSGIQEQCVTKEKTEFNSPVGDHSPSPTSGSLSNGSLSSNGNAKSSGRLRIKRHSTETLSNHSVLSNGVLLSVDDDESQKKENRSQMILHEVQNISDDQNKTEFKGKRKEVDGSFANRNGKFLKSDSSSSNSNGLSHIPNEILNNSINEDKSVRKPRRPIIRRRTLTSPSLPSLKLTPAIESSEKSNSIPESSILDSVQSAHKEPSPKEDMTVPDSVEKGADKKSLRTPSVDDLERMLWNDSDLTLDDVETPAERETEDMLLEIQQLIDS